MVRFKNNYVEPVSETGNWNVAFDYVKFKVSKLLIELDEYQEIARYGTANIVEEFTVDESMKAIARLKAIDRYQSTLMMLIENVFFAIRKSEDKEKIKSYYKRLKKIGNVIPELRIKRRINGQMKDAVDDEKFDRIFSMLINIKTNLNVPLNNADLIFNSVEEFDPEKFKFDIMKKMGERP